MQDESDRPRGARSFAGPVGRRKALLGYICLSAADKKVLLIDSSKFGKTALIRLAALTEFDEVITASGVPPQDAEALRKDGANLRVVDI